MKRILIFFFTVLVSVIIFYLVINTIFFHDSAPNPLKSSIEEFSIEDLQLGRFEIGMLYDEAQREFKGKIINVTGNIDILATVKLSDGIELEVSSFRVLSIITNSPSYATNRGLSVGDDRKKAFLLYGKPNEENQEGNYWLYYDNSETYNLCMYFKKDSINQLEAYFKGER